MRKHTITRATFINWDYSELRAWVGKKMECVPGKAEVLAECNCMDDYIDLAVELSNPTF
jgi:hypothetical protein